MPQWDPSRGTDYLNPVSPSGGGLYPFVPPFLSKRAAFMINTSSLTVFLDIFFLFGRTYAAGSSVPS